MKNDKIHSLHGIFHNIIKLHNKVEKTPRTYGTNVDLSNTEIHLIELIGQHNGLSVTELAKLHKVTKGAISQNLKRLEKKELILKKEDPNNISRSMINLSDTGKKAFDAHKKWHETSDGGFFDYFSSINEEQVDFLIETLTQIEKFYNRILSS